MKHSKHFLGCWCRFSRRDTKKDMIPHKSTDYTPKFGGLFKGSQMVFLSSAGKPETLNILDTVFYHQAAALVHSLGWKQETGFGVCSSIRNQAMESSREKHVCWYSSRITTSSRPAQSIKWVPGWRGQRRTNRNHSPKLVGHFLRKIRVQRESFRW